MSSPTTQGPVRSSETSPADPDRRASSEQAAATLTPPKLSNHDGHLSGDTTRAPTPVGDETDHTRAATPVTVENEKKDPLADGSVKDEPVGADEIEYPTGVAFAFIIVALVLSIFLVSLDMVCYPVEQILVAA
jgi:hypothetical protein